ncbi:hypothetical protein ES702_05357 [subsurface metagenome]
MASGRVNRTMKVAVKLVVGMLSPVEELFGKAEKVLSKHFGEIDFSSKLIPFTHTKYYDKEMGAGILRKFISFKDLIDAGDISEIKNLTCAVERQFSSSTGARRINLDPGYVSYAKLILATTKNYDHRVYLKDGIYAEVTLHFRNGSFNPFEWTYADYRTEEYIEIFNKIRTLFLEQLKKYRP